MGSFRLNKLMIFLLIALIGLSAWYYFNGRRVNEAPEKADLVFLQNQIE